MTKQAQRMTAQMSGSTVRQERHHTAPQRSIPLMVRTYRHILPAVHIHIQHWRTVATSIPDEQLRTQALASIETKQFHCEGGAVCALAHDAMRPLLIELIVALQTISDYLDNLSDRSTCREEKHLMQLHAAMEEAVDMDATLSDYYRYDTHQDDGGYLRQLVMACRTCIRALPSYASVAPAVQELVHLYTRLQVYKHIDPAARLHTLHTWWLCHHSRFPTLHWNEFAAATGSTLGMFMLFVVASREGVQQSDAQVVMDAYFPYVCGLHILLDYIIDREEDHLGGDLNFCDAYTDDEELFVRLQYFVAQANTHVLRLPDAPFHRLIIDGLLAMYLSDPKVHRQPSIVRIRRKVMRRLSFTRVFFWMNSVWIRWRSGRHHAQLQTLEHTHES